MQLGLRARRVFRVKSRVGQMAHAMVSSLNSVPLPRVVTRYLKYEGDIIPCMLLKDDARSCVLASSPQKCPVSGPTVASRGRFNHTEGCSDICTTWRWSLLSLLLVSLPERQSMGISCLKRREKHDLSYLPPQPVLETYVLGSEGN